jgi:predicted nucleic acid-binding protein
MTTDAETIFIDMNILIYATNDESPFQKKATSVLNQLMSQGIEGVISPQIVREYLVVFTRGDSPNDAARSAALYNVGKFLEAFTLLNESRDTVTRLQVIVEKNNIGGKQIHDANIVAVMQEYGIKRLLTHNLDDFKRYGEIEIMNLDMELR